MTDNRPHTEIPTVPDLLKTKLTEVELRYLEKRLSEERLAVAMLNFMRPSDPSRGNLPDALSWLSS